MMHLRNKQKKGKERASQWKQVSDSKNTEQKLIAKQAGDRADETKLNKSTALFKDKNEKIGVGGWKGEDKREKLDFQKAEHSEHSAGKEGVIRNWERPGDDGASGVDAGGSSSSS